MIGDEIHSAEIHGFITSIKTDVTAFGLTGVSRRTYDQTLDVVEDALIFGVRITHDDHLLRKISVDDLQLLTQIGPNAVACQKDEDVDREVSRKATNVVSRSEVAHYERRSFVRQHEDPFMFCVQSATRL